ncbi:MAG: hypothetical protein PVSMB3_04680 [Candidatus Dormibacteraceae bacterium]
MIPLTADELLDRARRQLVRVDPEQAARELADGALLVDIRPSEQRAEGEIPGATVVGRNVLEWRLDPASKWKIPEVTGHDMRLIVICNEGYSSSLVECNAGSPELRREPSRQTPADPCLSGSPPGPGS